MLNELMQLAGRLNLTGSSPFIKKKIHWFIDLNAAGELVDLSPTVSNWVKAKTGETQENRGKEYLSPVAFYIKINESGKIIAAGGGGKAVAEPGAGNIPEIFCKEINVGKDKVNIQPLKDSDNYKYSNLLTLHKDFADKYPNSYLANAVYHFLKKSTNISLEDIFSEIFRYDKDEYFYRKKMKEIATETFSFRVSGKLILNDSSFKKWWENEYSDSRNKILSVLPEGVDLLSMERNSYGKLTTVFPHISGVPNGGPYCPLASFDKDPFQSYGFDSITTPMLLENAEKIGASLNWLLHDDYSHLKISDIVSVFWSIPQQSDAKIEKPTFVSLLESSDPFEVREYLSSPWTHTRNEIETSKFYLALISSPKARITLRSWRAETLKEAEKKLKSYFQTILIPLNGEDITFSISELAAVTVRKPKKGQPAKPLPNTYISLFEMALFGVPVPHKLFKEVLIRQGVEIAKGAEEKDFEKRLAARTAIIKLFFKTTKGGDMEQEEHTIETTPGYLCGRLLAILDKIHHDAHRESGGTNNSPANRVYSAASKTPALIFPRLCNLARHHLNKIGGGWANCLEYGIPKEERGDGINEDFEGLAKVCSRLKETVDKEFPRTLSLVDQGRFAIGFYYEREHSRKLRKKENSSNNKTDADPNIETETK
ncbi:MAG: hypothetical protein CV087_21995 [Candidatus Brocadia sp. WS118]|nr:MAG: hypothetical protein CV087_21995 [Candidatus Brocadia sp. WS118]